MLGILSIFFYFLHDMFTNFMCLKSHVSPTFLTFGGLNSRFFCVIRKITKPHRSIFFFLKLTLMSYRCYKEDNHKCSEPVMAPEGRILIYLKRHNVKELSPIKRVKSKTVKFNQI